MVKYNHNPYHVTLRESCFHNHLPRAFFDNVQCIMKQWTMLFEGFCWGVGNGRQVVKCHRPQYIILEILSVTSVPNTCRTYLINSKNEKGRQERKE